MAWSCVVGSGQRTGVRYRASSAQEHELSTSPQAFTKTALKKLPKVCGCILAYGKQFFVEGVARTNVLLQLIKSRVSESCAAGYRELFVLLVQARLVEELKTRSLDTAGTKPELVERLHATSTALQVTQHGEGEAPPLQTSFAVGMACSTP